MSLNKTARQQYSKVYQELAANGFNAAINLLACEIGRSKPLKERRAMAFEALCTHLELVEEQAVVYYRTGLPDYLVNSVLDLLEAHRIKFGKHQLKPTKTICESCVERKKSHKRI